MAYKEAQCGACGALLMSGSVHYCPHLDHRRPMKGLGHIVQLIWLAGAAGRPYSEALMRMAGEEGDLLAVERIAQALAQVPQHDGERSGIEPTGKATL